MKKTYVLTTKDGMTLPSRYVSSGGLGAAMKARTQLGGTKKMKIYLRETGKQNIREYLMGKKKLPKAEHGPFGQKHKPYGHYVTTHRDGV